MTMTIIDTPKAQEDRKVVAAALSVLAHLEVGQTIRFDPPLSGEAAQIVWDKIYVGDTRWSRTYSNEKRGFWHTYFHGERIGVYATDSITRER